MEHERISPGFRAGMVCLAGFLLLASATVAPAQQQSQDGSQRAAKVMRFFEQTRKALVETSSPEAVIKDFEAARQQFQAGDIDQALSSLERTMTHEARKPTFRVLWSPYDQTVQIYEKFDRARSFMERLVIAFPNVADVRAALAAAYGEYASALQRAPQPDIGEIIRYANLSLQHLDVALAIEPDNFMALLGRAITYSYAPGGMKNAEQDFNSLLALQVGRKHPWYPYQMAYLFYADALKRGSKPERAAEILRVGLTYFPLDESLKKSLDELEKVAGQGAKQ